MPRLQIPEKLARLVEVKKRFKIAIGGRSSGKSTGFANIFIMKVQTEMADLLCLREFQSSINQSVHKLLKKRIVASGAVGFTVLDNKIVSAVENEIIFKGMARNSSAIKSAEDFKYSWVEEAQTCSQESLDDLLPTIRRPGSELWFCANPQSSNDPFSQRFIVPFKERLDRDGFYEDDLHLIVVINWRDNPWHTKELEQQRVFDKINMPRAKYDWIWEGHFNDSVENSIILPEWFDAAVDAHLKLNYKPLGIKVVAHDPSDTGDAKGLALRHGSVVLDVQENTSCDVNDGCDWALDYAFQNNVDLFTWDCDGLGVTLRRQVVSALAGRNIDYQMFKGSERPDNPNDYYQDVGKIEDETKKRKNEDTFRNKRAQYYWRLRDRFYNTYRAVEYDKYINPEDMISLSSNIKDMEKLRSEVCRIPRKQNGSGLIQIMNKQDMKVKHKLPSPNMADSLMMSLVTTQSASVVNSRAKPVQRQSAGGWT